MKTALFYVELEKEFNEILSDLESMCKAHLVDECLTSTQSPTKFWCILFDLVGRISIAKSRFKLSRADEKSTYSEPYRGGAKRHELKNHGIGKMLIERNIELAQNGGEALILSATEETGSLRFFVVCCKLNFVTKEKTTWSLACPNVSICLEKPTSSRWVWTMGPAGERQKQRLGQGFFCLTPRT